MQINGTSNKNTDYNRITGLATGMDIDGMVNKMLTGDNMKLDQMKQGKQIEEWQQEAYIDIINDLKEFYDSYLDILAPSETNLMSNLAYSGLKVQSSDENKIKAIALGGAAKGNYAVKVLQVAETARKQSDAFTEGTDLNTKLETLGISNGTMKFQVGDKEFSVNVDNTKSIGDFLSDIRNTKLSSDSEEPLGNHINISFSELTRKFTIETKKTGATETLSISGTPAEILKINGSFTGKDAKVSIKPPGETEYFESKTFNKNIFTIDNIQYDIDGANINDEVNIDIKADATDKIEKFRKFIDKYNSLIDKIKTKIDEKKEYKFKPLTEEQKKELSDDEIKRWEEKAKKGILSREASLSSLLTNLRETFYSTVEGAGLSAQEIGIETTGKWKDGGKLKLNEAKLKEALETKGDQVQKLFTQSSDNKNEKGILQRFKETFNSYIGSEGVLIKKAGYKDTRWVTNNDLSNKIEKRNKSIKEMQEKIYRKQEKYYNMFAVLERNMNNLNSQSNWLYSQMGMS